ncbi:MAG: hypothetical protein WB780_20345 [Candidatus Acidiferrales bacterium]
MAKSKGKKGGGHAFGGKRGPKGNPFKRRRPRHHNPAFAGFANMTDLLVTLVAAAIGGIADAYIPSTVLTALGMTSNLASYAGELLVAVIPAWLGAKYPNAAKGWLIGAGVNIVGHVVDDATGNQYIVFKGPNAGVSSFYAPNQGYPLPAPSVFGQFAGAGGQRLLGAGTPASRSLNPMSIGAGGAPGLSAVRFPFAA